MTGTFQAIDPSTREPFEQLVETTPEAVGEAVERAQDAVAAARDWRRPAVRQAALAAVATAIRGRADELAGLECRDTGKPLSQARADVDVTARYFDYYAGAADKHYGRSIPLGPDHVDYTLREPWGVCATVIPWNYPLQVLARTAAPALACGNAVVLKPSELGSVTPAIVAGLARDAGVPPGLLQVVTGHAAAGEALVAHPGVDHVTFVGSAATGRAVAHACADRLVPAQLELGGKSPNVVFADADAARAVPAIVRALIQNAGQSCSAGTRLLVHESRAAEFLDGVAAAMDALSIGPGPEDPDLGPLISAAQIERAEAMLDRAWSAGVQLVRGGGRPREGWYLEPTLVTAVRPEHELFREEVFGPVLAVTTFADEAEAVELANGSPYGLVAAVWTQDVSRAHRVAGAIRAGQLYVNGYGVAGGIEIPFGGMRQSGYGRGKSMDAMETYTQVKNVCVAL